LTKIEPIFYPGNDVRKMKLSKIKSALEKFDLDGLLLFKPESVRYVTDFYVKGFRPFMDLEYFALVPRDGDIVLGYTSGSDNNRLEVRSLVKDYRKISSGTKGWVDAVRKALEDRNLKSGKIWTDFLSLEIYKGIADLGNEYNFSEEFWTEITAIKSPEEISILRSCARIVDSGIKAASESIKAGVREIDVAAEAEFAMRKAGSEMTPFITNVASGENASIFERVATERVIGPNETVIVDLGAVYRGYSGDMGRTFVTGDLSETQSKIYKSTLKALNKAIEGIKPGVKCSEIDAISRKSIIEDGYGDYMSKFSLGHQIGFALHGKPMIDKNVSDLLRENMVICLEPRILIHDDPKVGGVHLEDMILVTKDGHEVLTKSPFLDIGER